jgi:hypothetical protein
MSLLLFLFLPLFLVFGFAVDEGHSGKWKPRHKPSTPPAEVPGPLPILGVGAALVYSRKIKSRINQQQ